MGDSTQDVTVAEELAVSSNGTIHVPARFQANHVGSCYNQEVQTRVETPEGPTEAMEFTAFVTASSCITIPSEIRDFGNIEAGDSVSVEMEPTGNSWSPEDGGRKDYTGESYAIPDDEVTDDEEVEEAIDEVEEEMEEMEQDDDSTNLEELFADDEEDEDEDEQEEEGLGELFG